MKSPVAAGGASFFEPRRSSSSKTHHRHDSASRGIEHTASCIGVDRSTSKFAGAICVPLLPENIASWKSRIRFLTPSSWILHVPRCHRSASSSPSFRTAWKARPSQKHSLTVYGRSVQENRYSAMYSTSSTVPTYTYSGTPRSCQLCRAGVPIEQFVLDLCGFANTLAQHLFREFRTVRESQRSNDAPNSVYNACLVNWYAPEHTIGLHSDDEPELDTSWPIVTLSWGGPRRFLLRSKNSPRDSGNRAAAKTIHEFVLQDGDLFVMGGKCQDEFKHEIPRVRSTKDGLVGNRISWTLRCMRPTPKVVASGKPSLQRKEQQQPHPSRAAKRKHEESRESSSRHEPCKPPRKRVAIFNPYARPRG